MDVVVPMAANLQLVFYKKKQWDRAYPESNVLVRILCNERNVGELNLNAYIYNDDIEDMAGNYYTWASLKNYMHEYIHYLEHVRQLNAINTMVGTAQANTKTAGKFGKGSEEHGQTLPAVLVPNGQNFWTPQTQDTEKSALHPIIIRTRSCKVFATVIG